MISRMVLCFFFGCYSICWLVYFIKMVYKIGIIGLGNVGLIVVKNFFKLGFIVFVLFDKDLKVG